MSKFDHIYLVLFSLIVVTLAFFNKGAHSMSIESIQGGREPSNDSYAYTVLLHIASTKICSGGIIGERFILTVAHCVVNKTGAFYGPFVNAVVGAVDVIERGVTLKVDKYYVPLEFKHINGVAGPKDIAVLRLAKNLTFGSYPPISKLTLPTTDSNYSGLKAEVSGFGLNKYPFVQGRGNQWGLLRYASLKVISLEKCVYDDAYETTMCGQILYDPTEQPRGTCDGDSGGPLVYKQQYVIGVLSRGPTTCNETVYPSIYTDVFSYKKFIDDAMSDRCDHLISVLI